MNNLLELGSTNFMPHGHCYFWDPAIMWTHAISDGIIALAYFVIPVSLIKIVRRRKDFSYTWMLILFAVFIWGCGATHVMDVINIWEPWYRTDSALRVITALASIGTAVMLAKITPQLILFPSAKKWKEMNEELRSLNEQLEEKVAERTGKYQEAAAKFEFLTDSIPQLVWTSDAEGQITYLNEGWTKIDLPKPSVSEKGAVALENAIYPDDRPKVTASMEKALAKGKAYEMEIRLRHKNGEYCWYLVRSLPMKTQKEEVNFWLGTATNIHEHKLAQEKLIQTKEELLESNKELNRINTDLDNFVYTASHDLRSPITNLESIATLFQSSVKEKLGEREVKLIDMMQTSVHRLKATIDDLTEVTKAQKGTEPEPEQVFFQDIVAGVMDDLSDLIRQSGAEIQEDYQVDSLYYSRKDLRSIVYNLISNAVKYHSPDRSPVIKIKTLEHSDSIELQISDNGLGLNEQQQGKLFTMFKRLHTHAEGTGIGLYIIKRIIENQEGRIVVESEEGKGSTFHVYFQKVAEADVAS